MAKHKDTSVRLNTLSLVIIEDFKRTKDISLSETVNQLLALSKDETSKKVERTNKRIEELYAKVDKLEKAFALETEQSATAYEDFYKRFEVMDSRIEGIHNATKQIVGYIISVKKKERKTITIK